jgi:hypothetical protein
MPTPYDDVSDWLGGQAERLQRKRFKALDVARLVGELRAGVEATSHRL